MDLFDKESGSLYLTYDRFHNILHASREGEGTDGFLRHIHDDVSLILQEGHDPNVWFTYFEFPDKRDIPNLALKDMSLFFEKTTRAAERSNARCRYTVNAADVIYCFKNGIVPLTPQAEKACCANRKTTPCPQTASGTIPRKRMSHYLNTAPIWLLKPKRSRAVYKYLGRSATTQSL